MSRRRTVESAKDRVGMAHDAGLPRISFLSLLAGVLVAYGAFAVLTSLFGGVAAAAGGDFEIHDGNWETAGVVGAGVLGLTLFGSYLFGSYVAGRMARRSGALHGLMVFVLSLVIAGVVGGFVTVLSDTAELRDSALDTLDSVGVPTTSDDLRTIGSIGGIVALGSMLLGSLIGGRLGDRWHGKLLTRALDPTVGATAEKAEHTEHTDDRPIDLRERDRDDDYVRETIGPLDDSPGRSAMTHDRPMNSSQRVAVDGARNREIERFNPTKPF